VEQVNCWQVDSEGVTDGGNEMHLKMSEVRDRQIVMWLMRKM